MIDIALPTEPELSDEREPVEIDPVVLKAVDTIAAEELVNGTICRTSPRRLKTKQAGPIKLSVDMLFPNLLVIADGPKVCLVVHNWSWNNTIVELPELTEMDWKVTCSWIITATRGH